MDLGHSGGSGYGIILILLLLGFWEEHVRLGCVRDTFFIYKIIKKERKKKGHIFRLHRLLQLEKNKEMPFKMIWASTKETRNCPWIAY